ncbi:MAG: HEAT repeat domain-containing protein [Planctomycetota bacterium]|jgi:DNA recombination-dependent growth factor C|nr:HEAT repeat domain-containing protein [Planctomycetota bacterium]
MRGWVLFGLLLLGGFGCVDTTVTRPYQEEDLTIKEIRQKLQSGDFRQKLEASKQIDKLPLEERLRVVTVLSVDPAASTRLLAVKKLAKIEDPRSRIRLEKMSKEDPDPVVQELAATFLSSP